jgi:hypothetical protein
VRRLLPSAISIVIIIFFFFRLSPRPYTPPFHASIPGVFWWWSIHKTENGKENSIFVSISFLFFFFFAY